jgi:hypothetical protein
MRGHLGQTRLGLLVTLEEIDGGGNAIVVGHEFTIPQPPTAGEPDLAPASP